LALSRLEKFIVWVQGLASNGEGYDRVLSNTDRQQKYIEYIYSQI